MSRTALEVAVELTAIVCNEVSCGIAFAAPTAWERERRRDHRTWYCPNGHPRYFQSKSEEERLQAKVAELQGNLNYNQERLADSRRRNERLERSRSALRGVATKLKNKALAGECGFCEQRFDNVAAHVSEAHPEATAVVEQDDAE